MLFNSAALLFLAAAAQAIKITAPADNATWTAGVAQTITWDSVDGDVKEFELQLEIPNSAKIEKTTIAETVSTSSGSYSYTPDASTVGDKFRITFASKDDKNTGILAQSGYFEIEKGTGAAASSSAASSSTSGSASASASSSASGQASQSSVSAAAVPTGSTSNSTTTSTGNSTLPNTSDKSGASALLPSLALVGGSLVALML